MDTPTAENSTPTHEMRRNDIVNRRLWKGFGGMLVGFGVAMGVLMVDHFTGYWLMIATLLIMGASGYYLIQTVLRSVKKHRAYKST